MFDYLIVGAGFAGSVLAERLARSVGQARADRRQAAAHRRQRLRPLRRRRASWSTSTGRTSSTPTRARSSTTCRGSPSGGPTSTACWRSVDGQLVPIPINLDTINQLYGLELTSFELEEFFSRRRRAARRVCAPRRTSIVEQGRPRAVREVLPQLHPQAVGPRPLGARRQRDRARARAHQPRRPLLHRHLPGDAAARLHADVRAHARPPEHQGHAEHRLPRDRRHDSTTAR